MAKRKRGASGLCGILPVDKPSGMTSHDVVARIRRATGEGRVGHAGTLDPMATGLLVVLVGPATRLAPFLTSAEKGYDARIVFGAETDTDDADGRVVRTAAVPDALCDESVARSAVEGLVGEHEQIPPAFSAIKVSGVVAHRAARSGAALELEARRISVLDARCVDVDPGPPVAWDVALRVSKGTYVRALARDLGRELGTAAHLGALRRTSSGSMGLEGAANLESLTDADAITAAFKNPFAALGMVAVQADPARVAVGGSFPAPEVPLTQGQLVACADGDRLVGVYIVSGTDLVPKVVIPGGLAGAR